MQWWGRFGGWLVLVASVGGALAACSRASAPARPAPAARSSARTTPVVATPAELDAYCKDLNARRAVFHPDMKLEVRGASLEPHAGYEPRPLGPDERATAGTTQAQIFVAPESVVAVGDLVAPEIRPSWRKQDTFDVMMRARSPSSLAPRLQPLVGGLLAVIVDERLIWLPHLKAPVGALPVALELTLRDARAVAARLGPTGDAATLLHLEEECFDRDPALCVALAEERLIGSDAPYDAERAVELFEAGCRLGAADACKRAAELATDARHAAALLESACRLNQLDACLQTAAPLLRRPAAAAAIAEGRAILRHACDQGDGRACMALAEELANDFPAGVEPPLEDQQAWLALVERACDGRDPDACFTRAKLARRGLSGPPDAAAAQRWFRAGCRLDPSGGSTEIEVKFGAADPALLEEIRKAGCSGELAPPPPRPSLCGSATTG
jgi:hypothetical protein